MPAGAGGGGGQGKGERGRTRTPENPGKHVKPVPGMPGRWQVKDPHTGKWKIKPPGWSPETAQRMILGVEVGATAYVIYRVVRMLPSLTPWTWETIPLNLATP
jgi:hypothetical protein